MLQGVLTPFDNLSGFERKVHAPPHEPSAAQQRTAGQASTSGATMLSIVAHCTSLWQADHSIADAICQDQDRRANTVYGQHCSDIKSWSTPYT